MHVKLHANATTTPKVRAYIQQSNASPAALARELGVSETTIRRWRKRRTVSDRSHVPKTLATSLSPVEERLICELRSELALSLDDIAEVMRRCVRSAISRSAVHRCLRRHGLNRRTRAAPAPVGVFETVGIGFVHVDLKHLPALRRRKSYVFVAIDRATRFVHVEIADSRSAEAIAACLERFLEAFPYRVHTILTDNGSEFTDRFAVDMKGKPEGKPSGRHSFDLLCAVHGIEHRLTRPFTPQTNGMVERFNRRIAEALRRAPPDERNAGKNRFDNHDERNRFIHDFVYRYNQTRLRCLGYNAPVQALYNPPEHNTEAGDRDGAPAVLDAIRRSCPWLRHVFADGGYAGPKLRAALARIGAWTIQIVKRSDTANGFEVIPRRWVVERTFAWLGRCRRLGKDWEKSIASAEAWVNIAHIRLTTRRLARHCFYA